MDASLLFNKGQIETALVTGNDELTPNYFTLLGRLGYWKDIVEDTLNIINNNQSSGSFAGEGSLSFVFSKERKSNTYATFRGMDLFYKPLVPISLKIESFLSEFGLTTNDVDVFMTGMNGDKVNDLVYTEVSSQIFNPNQIGIYKHICGEFYTSAAYGLFAASCCLQIEEIPAHLMLSGLEKKGIKHILLYNHFRNKDHSLILLSI
jgi:hypothetical protein